MPSMMASILVFDEPTQVLRKGGYGRLPSTFQDAIDGMEPGPVTGSCGTAAYRKDRVICEDVRIDPLWTPFREFAVQYGIQSAWSTPILSAKGKLIGVFGMYYGDCRKPSVDDAALGFCSAAAQEADEGGQGRVQRSQGADGGSDRAARD